MNTPEETAGWDECLLYDKIQGVTATANTFYPFDCGVDKLSEILNCYLVKLNNIPCPQLAKEIRGDLSTACGDVIGMLSNERATAEDKSQGLLIVFMIALVASWTLQDRFGFVTPFWSKVASRFDGAVFGWRLGWRDREKESELRSRIAEFCFRYGFDLRRR